MRTSSVFVVSGQGLSVLPAGARRVMPRCSGKQRRGFASLAAAQRAADDAAHDAYAADAAAHADKRQRTDDAELSGASSLSLVSLLPGSRRRALSALQAL